MKKHYDKIYENLDIFLEEINNNIKKELKLLNIC